MLKIVVMIAQLIVWVNGIFKWVDCMIYELYLNIIRISKLLKRKKVNSRNALVSELPPSDRCSHLQARPSPRWQ